MIHSLFPLNCPGWFTRNIISYPVDALNLIYDTISSSSKEFMVEVIVIGCHAVSRSDRAQCAGVVVGAVIAHNPHRANRQ